MVPPTAELRFKAFGESLITRLDWDCGGEAEEREFEERGEETLHGGLVCGGGNSSATLALGNVLDLEGNKEISGDGRKINDLSQMLYSP